MVTEVPATAMSWSIGNSENATKSRSAILTLVWYARDYSPPNSASTLPEDMLRSFVPRQQQPLKATAYVANTSCLGISCLIPTLCNRWFFLGQGNGGGGSGGAAAGKGKGGAGSVKVSAWKGVGGDDHVAGEKQTQLAL